MFREEEKNSTEELEKRRKRRRNGGKEGERGRVTKQGENVSQRQRAKHGRAESERRYCHKLN